MMDIFTLSLILLLFAVSVWLYCNSVRRSIADDTAAFTADQFEAATSAVTIATECQTAMTELQNDVKQLQTALTAAETALAALTAKPTKQDSATAFIEHYIPSTIKRAASWEEAMERNALLEANPELFIPDPKSAN